MQPVTRHMPYGATCRQSLLVDVCGCLATAPTQHARLRPSPPASQNSHHVETGLSNFTSPNVTMLVTARPTAGATVSARPELQRLRRAKSVGPKPMAVSAPKLS